MRTLKALVIGMGVLIVVALTVIVTTLVRRAAGPAVPGGGAVTAPVFGARAVALPPGARVVSASAEGDRLIIHLRLAGGGARVIVLDLRTGLRLGTVDLAPSPGG